MSVNRKVRRQALRDAKKSSVTKPPITRRAFNWVRVNRNKAIAIGLAGALALGGARYYRDVPYWVGAKKSIHLSLLFATHEHKIETYQIEKEILRAKAAGKPYHLMLVESSGFPQEQFVQKVRQWNNYGAQIRMDYQNLARQGMPQEEATRRLRKYYASEFEPGFDLEVTLLLAREGIRIAPAERYDTQTRLKIEALEREAKKRTEKVNQAFATNANLEQLGTYLGDITQVYQQLAQLREQPTVASIKDTIAHAKQLFPDLKKEREVRIITQFGTYHREGLLPQQFDSRRVETHEVMPQKDLSLISFAAESRGKVPNYREFESRLEALAVYLEEPIRAISKGNAQRGVEPHPDMAQRLFDNATKVTAEEYRELSERTKDLPAQERTKYLLGYFSRK
jgi:hypothetical protein